MNRLPTPNSFQGVLDSIIRNYLINELPPDGGESSRRNVAENDLSFMQGFQLANGTGNGNTSNGNTNGSRGINLTANSSDQEYIQAVYKCFEKRGVFKELQTFLRHKLVSILQEEWPDLQNPVGGRQKQKDGPNLVVYRLVDDFLRCHNLLYTLSVLASEADVNSQPTRVLCGKLSAKDAEGLLDEIGIKKESRLNGQILKVYFDNEHYSLLESMQYLGVWLDNPVIHEEFEGRKRRNSGESIVLRKRDTRNGTAREKVEPEVKSQGIDLTECLNLEARLFELEKKMEVEKAAKIKEAIEKYKRDEQVKLKEQLETKFKLDLIEKERDNFHEVQRKLTEMSEGIQEERQEWLSVKLRQEKELCELKRKLNELTKASVEAKNTTRESSESDESPVQKCQCRSKKQSAIRVVPFQSYQEMDPIEQDKLAFLQYRMEQQDDEIKRLRKQLLTGSRVISVPMRDPCPEVSVPIIPNVPENSNNPPKDDDLAKFLEESKERVGKHDIAVGKVNEILHELFSKRRSPISNQLSTHLMSAQTSKSKALPGLSQLYSSLHNLSTITPIPPPPLITSQQYDPPRNPVHLVQQQVPQNLKPFSNVASPTFTHSYNMDDISFVTRQEYPSPPLKASLLPRDKPTCSRNLLDKFDDIPTTPVNKIFPVAYSNQTNRRESPPKQSPVSGRLPVQSPDNSHKLPQQSPDSSQKLPEQSQSLFHMALLQSDSEQPELSKSLHQAAIRNGALSREKILSSDEGENSQSISLPKSSREKSILKQANIPTSQIKAITKTRVSPEQIEPRRNPVKPISPPSSHPSSSRSGQPNSPHDDNTSLSISAPKSVQENNEDFWQM